MSLPSPGDVLIMHCLDKDKHKSSENGGWGADLNLLSEYSSESINNVSGALE